MPVKVALPLIWFDFVCGESFNAMFWRTDVGIMTSLIPYHSSLCMAIQPVVRPFPYTSMRAPGLDAFQQSQVMQSRRSMFRQRCYSGSEKTFRCNGYFISLGLRNPEINKLTWHHMLIAA